MCAVAGAKRGEYRSGGGWGVALAAVLGKASSAWNSNTMTQVVHELAALKYHDSSVHALVVRSACARHTSAPSVLAAASALKKRTGPGVAAVAAVAAGPRPALGKAAKGRMLAEACAADPDGYPSPRPFLGLVILLVCWGLRFFFFASCFVRCTRAILE